MGFSDRDFEEVLKEYPSSTSKRNATLYKLAGNSIVVNVLEAIFEELLNEQFEKEFICNDGQMQLIVENDQVEILSGKLEGMRA